ncbi:uncharacterized protein LOC111089387 [Limulus polyphemus]|uniref:Uncharacterized protein LOC111089387 n=1 Tax=Limulus polyphemus TaxID=6850 RepID=A0ABM1TNP7_LIMPO|nr:uncharacterized protein LOC111089387 [Limulus polyphemus]
MPYSDSDLLWCPDADGKMIDFSCLDSGPNINVQQQPDVFQELLHTDLHSLVPELAGEEEEIMRQFSDPGFELDNIFDDIQTKIENSGLLDQLLMSQSHFEEIQTSLRKKNRKVGVDHWVGNSTNSEEIPPFSTSSSSLLTQTPSLMSIEEFEADHSPSTVKFACVSSNSSKLVTSSKIQNPGPRISCQNSYPILAEALGVPAPSNSTSSPSITTSSLLAVALQSSGLPCTTSSLSKSQPSLCG